MDEELLTCEPAIQKFVFRVAPVLVAPKLQNFLIAAGFTSAAHFDAFSSFTGIAFKNWILLDFSEIREYADDPLIFWSYIFQLRNFLRMKTALIPNSEPSKHIVSQQRIVPRSHIIDPACLSLSTWKREVANTSEYGEVLSTGITPPRERSFSQSPTPSYVRRGIS